MRYERAYERVREAHDRRGALRELTDHELVQALAAASKEHDPYLANVLATEAQNRVGQKEMVLHHMGDGVFVIDREGGVLMANPQAGRLLGRRSEDMLGEDMHDLTACGCEDAGDRSRASCPILRAAKRGRTLECVARYRRADGSDAVLEINASPFERDGEPSGAVIVLRDVEERRRTEARLERLAAMVRSSNDAIVATTPEGVITEWNPGAERLFGWTAEEVVGAHARVLAPAGKEEEVARNLRRVARGETFEDFETARRRKDGSLVDVSLSASPLREGDRVVGVVAVFRDVTERRRLEAALRARDERSALAARATNDVVWDWDANEDRLVWSENMQSAFGYRPEEAPATFDAWAELVHPDDRPRVEVAIRAWLDGDRAEWWDEYRFRRRTGGWAWVLDRGVVVRDADGRPVRVVGSLQDVTDRKATEEHLARLIEGERERRREAERRASTWVPALAWGAGVALGLALAVLLVLALIPGPTRDGVQLGLVVLVLLAGLAVGLGVRASRARRA